ncbi:MAG: hypothetical protein NW216_12000 [Hyphomicrobium sp.]|nr:hypothetical protein [Hyphomicrobium sp.]
MLVKTSLELPAVMKRASDAFAAGDPIALSECFTPNARLVTQLDKKLAAKLGLSSGLEPVEAVGQLDILKYYALELSSYDLTYFDVMSAVNVGRDIGIVYQWCIKLRESGSTMSGICHTISSLDPSSRRIAYSHDIIKTMEIGWGSPFH